MINYMRERELFVRVRLRVGLYYTHARTQPVPSPSHILTRSGQIIIYNMRGCVPP